MDPTEPVTLADVAHSHKPKAITTIGWLLRQDEVGVSIANEYYDEDSTYRGRTFIMASMVQSVTEYQLSKPRKPRAKRLKSAGDTEHPVRAREDPA